MSPANTDMQSCEFCNASTYLILHVYFPCQSSGIAMEMCGNLQPGEIQLNLAQTSRRMSALCHVEPNCLSHPEVTVGVNRWGTLNLIHTSNMYIVITSLPVLLHYNDASLMD